ncbi:MAG: NAD(P)H-hydrate dehydratase [Paracoccaceae bacterium]
MDRIARASLPALDKAQGHKHDHGRAAVLSGGPGRGGAARLSARAALRVGAGAVTLICHPDGLAEAAAALPDAVMTEGPRDADALAAWLSRTSPNALCLGPGLGLDGAAQARLDAALDWGGPLILDADALTLLSHGPRPLDAAHVLTPHLGELRRLMPGRDGPDETPEAKVDAARAAAARWGATVLVKGAVTAVATPDGAHRVHAATGDRSAPWLATAGAGDVLAGMICGLRARGLSPLDAAAAAVWLHVEAARSCGPGLIADDLVEALPAALAAAIRPDGTD